MTYKAIKADLNALAAAFNLGAVTEVRTQENALKGHRTAIFSTEKEQNLKYHFKTN